MNNEDAEKLECARLAIENHERMNALYLSDPEAFYVEVRRLIEEAINRAAPGNQPSLRGLQFQIDTKLARYKDPVARMNEMVRLLWKGVGRLDAVLRGESLPTYAKPATVLPFEPRRE